MFNYQAIFKVLPILLVATGLFLVAAQHSATAQPDQDPLSLFEEAEEVLRAKMVGVARNYVGISAGIGLPENEFASVYHEDEAGFARAGFLCSIDGAYLIFRNIGVAGTIARYSNGIKKDGFTKNVLYQLPPSATGAGTGKKWRNTLFAVGPTISLPEDKLVLDLRLLLGATFTNVPALNFTGMYNDAPLTVTRAGTKKLSPLWMLGASVSYPVPIFNDLDFLYHVRAFAKAEFISAAPKITLTNQTTSVDYTVHTQRTYKQTVGVFALAIGLRYEFGYADE